MLEGAHNAHVTDAAITRDCSKVISVAGDGSGAVWDLASGRREALLEGHTGEVRAVVLTQRGEAGRRTEAGQCEGGCVQSACVG